jgi:hypothetical protein
MYDHKIGFWKNELFFAENCQKSQKIEIITSAPAGIELCRFLPPNFDQDLGGEKNGGKNFCSATTLFVNKVDFLD